MKLKQLAKRVTESPGLLHQLSLRALRRYIKEAPIEQLVSEVEEIDDAASLRALWEAGLSSEMQDVVLKRLEKMR